LQQKYDDEFRQITPAEGMKECSPPPVDDAVIGIPPLGPSIEGREKYLWVVAPDEVFYAQENLAAVALKRGHLSHTNLTGGKEAHCAGEGWFIDDSTIIINGGSSRYRPRSAQELDAIAFAFKACGFRIASMGWEAETSGPVRYLRGEPQWL
jgi:hypothetical protein